MDFSECKNNTFFSIPQVFFLIFSFTDCVILIILTKALSIYGNVRVVMIFFNFSSVKSSSCKVNFFPFSMFRGRLSSIIIFIPPSSSNVVFKNKYLPTFFTIDAYFSAYLLDFA